jgi:putative lipoic acid-binding regulatory protein
MKKTLLLTLILVLTGTLNVFSQSNDSGLTDEQKMLPFAMAMSLSVVGEMHDEQYLTVLTMFQRQVRYWSEELKPVVEMKKDTADYKRLDIALTATKALRDKSSKSDKWQMLVGEYFGNIYAQLKKNQIDGREINADDLRFDIEMIGNLANNAPEDIPAKVNKKFKDFSKLKDLDNLTSAKGINKITDEVKEILDVISK